MVQGTTSDAGKSVLVAGLCRLLARHNISVAPFKPQNMALNSAVTVNGGEIGRSQALQAQACHLEPHTDFNPVLLKPSSDTGAQVIVHGHAVTAMKADAYHDYKRIAMAAVLESHERLCQQYSRILVEGAGSPAEINLRENDIANMGFAEAVDCPVILVADIDRGGVFAHLVGTLDVLSQSEQDRVIGFVINRFRGDISLLESGLKWLEERTGKPVLGVLPYLQDFYLDAEDAVCSQQFSSPEKSVLNVIVPVLSRISNHTDFDALRLHPQVNLQFVSVQQECPAADLIILPGSKNVRADMKCLIENGWQETLERHLRYGGKVIGICGGYQMLGKKVDDPNGVEDVAGCSTGFGFLNIETTLETKKKLKNVNGTFSPSEFLGAAVQGYEIHCGTTKVNQQQSLLSLIANDGVFQEGVCSDDDQIIGTYLHGLFDHVESSNAILNWAGLRTTVVVNLNEIREQQLERLADTLEKHLTKDALIMLLENTAREREA